jgi:hypothetical protein
MHSINVGLLALARSLSRQAGVVGALGIVGAVTAVLVAAVFAVQMAVDGVALKAAIEAVIVLSDVATEATNHLGRDLLAMNG